MSDIKVSIIIPVYNSFPSLPKLLDILTNQTYSNIEIILVDNNSKDESVKYIQKRLKDDSRIKLYHEKEQGPNYARRTGFLNSTGDYIYFCDSDDFPERDAIAKFVECIKNTHADVVIGDYNEVEKTTQNKKRKIGIFPKLKANNLKTDNSILLIKPALWNKIFQKDLIDKDSFVMSRIGEDMVITLLCLIKANNVRYINDIIYNYVPDINGLSNVVNEQNFLGIIESTNKLVEISKKLNKYDEYKQEIDFICISHLIYRTLRIALIEDEEISKRLYDLLQTKLNEYEITNNKYYRQKKPYQIARYLTNNYQRLNNGFIKFMFTNKIMYNIFKRLDK